MNAMVEFVRHERLIFQRYNGGEGSSSVAMVEAEHRQADIFVCRLTSYLSFPKYQYGLYFNI